MPDDHDDHFHAAFGSMPDGSSLRSPFGKVADAMGSVLNKRPPATQTSQPQARVDRRSDPVFAAKVAKAQAEQRARGG